MSALNINRIIHMADKDMEIINLRSEIERLSKAVDEANSTTNMWSDIASKLRSENERLKADELARLMEEPTNERLMKDVYDENERLEKENERLEAENAEKKSQMIVLHNALVRYMAEEK